MAATAIINTLGAKLNVNGTYSANQIIVDSNPFNFQNALGISVSARIICQFTGNYCNFKIGQTICYENTAINRNPNGLSLDINQFIIFQGLEYYYNTSKPFNSAFNYVTSRAAAVSNYVNKTNIYSSDTNPLNFTMPINACGFLFGVLGTSVTISSGFIRLDVICHR